MVVKVPAGCNVEGNFVPFAGALTT